ncbi:MAG TPA: cobaltochelatase subunit CobN, partial [Pyrinomonadaceae bacterium]|nr:cobaltochelatase subunit CobN [Pyrinomonadaceae bacterium]
MDSNIRDARVFELYEQLLEIEQRLIPTGLHIFGRASSAGEQIDLFKMIASFDRPEHGVRALPPELVDDAVREFVGNGANAAIRLLEARGLDPGSTRPVFELLEGISTKLQTNTEIDSLMRALRGEFIAPGPGADIIQNPDVLPTGRNTHAINPYSVPSAPAYARSEVVATSLLERYRNENGRYPEAMALVLWGLDNIKTQGEGVAQALWLLGVRPVRDALNRTTSVAVIPLEELGRPRIDVVMTVSGIFRDLFSPTVHLLDKAVRLVAELDEPRDSNYVRKHVLQQMEQDACDADEASVRVFSNAPGNYGTNVNFM